MTLFKESYIIADETVCTNDTVGIYIIVYIFIIRSNNSTLGVAVQFKSIINVSSPLSSAVGANTNIN
jgi:hypothetical protein